MIRIEDLSEVAYGGAVTLSSWWDGKRIEEGKIGSKDILKQAAFYTYLIPGLVATLMSVFGWMRRYGVWSEKVSTGFLYDLPRFAYNLSRTLTAAGKGRGSESAAVREAQKILEANRNNPLLTEGRETRRSYQQEFAEKTFAW